ncbi:unnamed protein product [Schistosoma turkestanicum]|nr:unnamed protein product [Schistosoma turkestanicum]
MVFISYGAHDNLTLFTEYGFILPFNEKNTNEVIYLSYRFIVNLFLHLMDSFTTPINGMSGSCNSTSMSNLIESFTHNRIIANKFETLQHSYSTTLCLYFHRILGKLNLCVPYNSADNHDSDDDVTWSSVYLSLNGSNNNRGPSYHLGLILFLLHTLISNMNNNNDKTLVDCQSLDNVYHISEDTIYTTIQTLLNRIYTILLDQLKYDREKIVHLMNTTTYQHDSSALLSSVHMKSTCLIDKFCKDFLYYFDQRECFIRSLMTS